MQVGSEFDAAEPRRGEQRFHGPLLPAANLKHCNASGNERRERRGNQPPIDREAIRPGKERLRLYSRTSTASELRSLSAT